MYPPSFLLCVGAVVMLLSTIGCESTSPEVESTALVTDGTSFQLEEGTWRGHVVYRGRIPYSFANRTGSRVYIPNCQGGIALKLEMEEAGQWALVWSPALLLCLDAPIVIEPGEVYETSLNVVGCLDGCAPSIRLPPTESTPIRIVWTNALSSYDSRGNPFGELIPLEERVSNTFTLQVSR